MNRSAALAAGLPDDAPASFDTGAGLAAEWERVRILAERLAAQRRGETVAESALARLRVLQDAVTAARRDLPEWAAAGAAALSPLECDIAACTIAPEADPYLGWLFQQMSGHPYPSAGLVAELLCLDTPDVCRLREALGPTAALACGRLVVPGDGSLFEPLEPGSAARIAFLGAAGDIIRPPGATLVTMRPSWPDLVLPAALLGRLRDFLLWVRYRDVVVGQWAGLDGGGPIALFTGPPGTGKTFAAAVLATDLGWPMWHVDLGRLVSKYIGETERNLNRLFDAVHGRPAVLQIDEADALFGRRGEIHGGRDRWANMSVSHLLDRVEQHRGPCILTTNLRDHLDPAFTRRFHIVVDFPRPDPDGRAQLWRRLLPARAPLAQEIDPVLLGNAVTLTGSGIRNAALHAAYLAASSTGVIGLPQIARAVWHELSKSPTPPSRADLGMLAAYLPEVA